MGPIEHLGRAIFAAGHHAMHLGEYETSELRERAIEMDQQRKGGQMADQLKIANDEKAMKVATTLGDLQNKRLKQYNGGDSYISRLVHDVGVLQSQLTAERERARRWERTAEVRFTELKGVCGDLAAAEQRVKVLEDVLKLAQKWLVNCIPSVDFGEPYPLPVIAAALTPPTPAEQGEQADGIALIAAERKRQVEVEKWTAQSDDLHRDGELANAAACYATTPNRREPGSSSAPSIWPWMLAWWKPSPFNRVRELAKAGALIAAEIDRLQRASTPTPQPEQVQAKTTPPESQQRDAAEGVRKDDLLNAWVDSEQAKDEGEISAPALVMVKDKATGQPLFVPREQAEAMVAKPAGEDFSDYEVRRHMDNHREDLEAMANHATPTPDTAKARQEKLAGEIANRLIMDPVLQTSTARTIASILAQHAEGGVK